MQAPELVSSCQTGCRFLAIIESVELFPGPDMNGTLKNCNNSEYCTNESRESPC